MVRRRVRPPRAGALEHVVLAASFAVLPEHPDRRPAARVEDRVHDPEVVEDLQGAGLEALAAGAGEEGFGLLHDERADAAACEVTGEGEPGGAGADDEDLGVRDPAVLNAVKFHACRVNLTTLSCQGVWEGGRVATERLDRIRVARTALRLLNEVGLEGLTLRGIAKELDVKAPALYWHFKDKQALLDEMATEMLRRMTADLAEASPPADWREAYAAAMRGCGHISCATATARASTAARISRT